MAINVSGILKSPQGTAIQNAEILFEQTRTSTEVLAGTKLSIITNQTGNYSSTLGVGTYVFKVRFQDEVQYRTVASNVIVTQAMNNYSINQIIQDQQQLQDVDYDLLAQVIQARDQAQQSAQAAQTSQTTASTKASEASSSAQAALASKNAAQTSEASALASKNAAQTSQTNAANSQTAAATSQTTASTKATEASNSAQAALTSKNAAQTSQADALASKNAAQSSQLASAQSAAAASDSSAAQTLKAQEAQASATQAKTSESGAQSAAAAAEGSKTQAQTSQTSASTSQATATTKASEASSSAQAALSSKNAAQTSQADALASKNAAQTSQSGAATSQTSASTSQTTATTKASEASASQTSASTSQTTATTKASDAAASQTSASTAQATATTKASEASTSQSNASTSQTTATTKAGEASASATLSQKWAANPENSVVSGGLYSALHYANKAAQAAQTANGQLIWRGGWSAQAGNPPPQPTGTTQDFYRITQQGTILSVQYEVGDYIHWDNINSIWFKMDGTDSVVSVNGRTGAVTLSKTDVGLSSVNNWGATSQTNDASTTTYATAQAVKQAYDLAAGKLGTTQNAASASKLATPRSINGTNFDGTANITTQNWGTSRNLTIGGTAKAVNGSADVSWTLAEIGAAPAGYGLGVTAVQKDAQDQTEGGFWRDAVLNLAGITMPYDGSPSQAFLAVNVLTNTLRFGKRTGATSVPISWYNVYSTNNKPTAADVGQIAIKVPHSGQDWTSQPAMAGKACAGGYQSSNQQQSYLYFGAQGGEATLDIFLDGQLYVGEGRQKVYHPDNKPTLQELGAAPATQLVGQGFTKLGSLQENMGQHYAYRWFKLFEHTGSSGVDTTFDVIVTADKNYPGSVGRYAVVVSRYEGSGDQPGVVHLAVTKTYGASDMIELSVIQDLSQSKTTVYVRGKRMWGDLLVNTITNGGKPSWTYDGSYVFDQVAGSGVKLLCGNIYDGDTNQINYAFNEYFNRVHDSGQRVYSPANKPSAQDLGVVPLSGQAVLSGYLSVEGLSGGGGYAVKRAVATHHVIYGQSSDASSALIWTQNNGTGGAPPTSFLKVGPTRFKYSNDGTTEYNVYHEGYMPTAANVGALSIGGGIVTGVLGTSVSDAMAIRAERAGHQTLMGCSNTVGDYLFGGRATSASDYQHYLRIGQNKLQFHTNSQTFNVLHEGNANAAMVNAFQVNCGIVTNQDWNTLTVSGSYAVQGYSGTNAPSVFGQPSVYTYGTLLVQNNSETICQIYITDRDKMYHRSKYRTNPWGLWVPVASDTTHPITTSIDLNSLWNGGSYNMYKGSGVVFTNAPQDFSYGTLQVLGRSQVTGSFVTQILTWRGNGRQMIRTRSDSDNSWSEWVKIYSESQKPTQQEVGAVPATQLMPIGGGTVNWADMVGRVPVINSAGVTELGRYIDMREQGANIDFNWRWDAGGAQDNRLSLYNSSSALAFYVNNAGAIGSHSVVLFGADQVCSVFVGGTRVGNDKALIRGQVEGGGYANWRARAAGLLVDCPAADTSAINVFKATNWGGYHLCALDVHRPGAGNTQAAFHVGGDNTFMFFENGQLHAGDVYIRSDRRLKSNFAPITGALEKVCSLQGSLYDKATQLGGEDTVREAGLVAQDLQEVLPEAVKESTSGILTVSSSAVNALLLEAIKELKEEVDQLRRQINGT